MVKETEGWTQMDVLVAGLRHYQEGNVIVYSPTISRVEETVDFLENQGIAAVGYHAKMAAQDRRRNQERWMSDEVRVLVGTIAFGLGINKAGVRAVIHLALPKSIEQYYQEAGRAGRDGHPADCVLLWQKKDAGLLGYFANSILDPAERQRAWQRYHILRDFVESGKCRHRQICQHFGETPKWASCGACDVCSAAPGWMTSAAPPSTPRRRKFSLPAVAATHADLGNVTTASTPDEDAELREYLREWRRTEAKERGMPSFVIMHDSTLEEICLRKPKSFAELLQITGIGERKAEMFGQKLLDALSQFGAGARASTPFEKKTAPALETLQLLRAGKTLEEIALVRGRQLSTVIHAVAGLLEAGEIEFSPDWISREKLAVIEAACAKVGLGPLKPIKDVLPPEISYDDIRIVVAKLRRDQALKTAI
jgi:ATP-dependent DNA helicase RecQ